MPAAPHPDDTIAALASASGGAMRGIIRISGPQLLHVLEKVCSKLPPIAATVENRRDVHRLDSDRSLPARRSQVTLLVPEVAHPLPTDLYLWPTARSYTRQPMAELHTLGSPPLLEALLAALWRNGARPALPGEFTLRAFLAGRIDLLQAEAVLGVIDACDDHQLRRSLAQLGGGVSTEMVRLRGDLLDLLADIEAGLDFVDEAIEFVSHASLLGRLGLAHERACELHARAKNRQTRGATPRVVLAGMPNAGKSALFNALALRDAALVSHVKGTTRDYLEAPVHCEGLVITLVDTAGYESAPEVAPRFMREESQGGISNEAQRLRDEQLQLADLVLWCVPSISDPSAADRTGAGHAHPPFAHRNSFEVRTKADLSPKVESARTPLFPDGPANGPAAVAAPQVIWTSAHSGEGIDQLRTQIARRLSDSAADPGQLLGATAARCGDSLERAVLALERALAAARSEADHDLLALEIRDALEELAVVVGAVYTDDLLDRIFSRFCIGK
jgi:tRNA modification GTPase